MKTLIIFSCLMIQFISNSSTVMAMDSEEDFLEFNGNIETRLGARLKSDPHEDDMSIGEVRLQLESEKDFDDFTINMITDFVADPVLDEYQTKLNTGEGFMDLRQLNVVFSPTDNLDLKIGRQILTWGTGDIIFINDLFAKDWKAFLIGRDEEYLKAPSDAIKASLFLDELNVDIVYLPRFGSDRFIDGQRASYYDRNSASFAGKDSQLQVDKPDEWFEDDELSLRFYQSFGAYEGAGYFYQGFWKSPAGQDINTSKATFPKLNVYGASLRGPMMAGIANIEVGYYKSEKSAKSNPFIRNDEFRLLMGFEKEVANELTLGLQYNLERKLDYQQYKTSLPEAAIKDDENKHLLSIRLTQLLMQQDMRLSLFNFYSPSEKDGYLRMNVSYKLSDTTKIETGANVFYGDKQYSFYNQFQNNSNVFAAMRFEF